MSVAAATSALGSGAARTVTPRVLGESNYDRLTSFLFATVLGAFSVVAWLSVVYLSMQAYGQRVAAPIEIIEVFGGGGGSPDGEEGATERVDVPDAEASPFASNNELEPSDFEEAAVERVPDAMLDAQVDSIQEVVEADLAAAMPTGGVVASGRRSMKLGTGGRAYGDGPGDGGVPREQRWSVVHSPGQTIDEYARELDALGVEVATIVGNQMHYASNLSAPTPTRRVTPGTGDNRLYFLWQGGGRREPDLALLRKAGIEVGPRGVIFHFYPQKAEEALARLEVAYKGRQPSELRSTRFQVVREGAGYAFKVIDQKTLR